MRCFIERTKWYRLYVVMKMSLPVICFETLFFNLLWVSEWLVYSVRKIALLGFE